jgi:hypothetical protein
MISEKLSFSHRDLLHERLKKINIPISEYSFPNLYLFRETHNYKVIFDQEIFIKGISYDGYTYLMPTVPVQDMDCEYVKEMMGTVNFLFPISEQWLSCFSPDTCEFTYKRGDMDYIYTVEKMRTYRGRNLHQKRNLLRRFTSTYRHEALPLTLDRLKHAIFILDEWQAENGQDPGQTDYSSCLEALKLYDELVLCGGIFYADAEPAGFILGEELNEETFALHFAKARRKFKGIYQYMFNTFAGVLTPKYRLLNLEQDLDKEALRIAKSSYLPDSMIKKVRVSLRKHGGGHQSSKADRRNRPS